MRSCSRFEKQDGSVFSQTLGGAAPVASTSDLSGRWKGTGESVGPVMERLELLRLTDAGALAKARYDISSDPSLLECRGMPTPSTVVAAAVLYVAEIEVNTDTVILRGEYYDSERTVFMDGRGHPENGERTHDGHSIGRWEGDVLVVDTTNVSDHPSPYQNGIPSGSQKHVVERYALSEDGTALTVDFVLEDPEYLAEPLTGTLDWKYRPDLEMHRYDCDPEVSGQFSVQ